MFRAAFFFFPPRGWVPFLGIPKSKEDMAITVPMTVLGERRVEAESWRDRRTRGRSRAVAAL